MLHSVIQSARAAGVKPVVDLRDVLQRIGTMPSERVVELLPSNWKAEREKR